jgi:hypothetical protein
MTRHRRLQELQHGVWVGRDPARLSPEAMVAAGIAPRTPLQAIQAMCRRCRRGHDVAIRGCRNIGCPLWANRTGVDPWAPPSSGA